MIGPVEGAPAYDVTGSSTVTNQSPPENVTELLTGVDGILSADVPEYSSGNEFELELDPHADSNLVLSSIIGLGIPIVSFSQRRKHLNQAFMDLTTRGART